jgi:hypothetical protein
MIVAVYIHTTCTKSDSISLVALDNLLSRFGGCVGVLASFCSVFGTVLGPAAGSSASLMLMGSFSLLVFGVKSGSSLYQSGQQPSRAVSLLGDILLEMEPQISPRLFRRFIREVGVLSALHQHRFEENRRL